MESNKAIIHYHKDRAVVLCPNGHYCTSIDLGASFGGSNAAVELASRQNGQSNVYDRLALACAEQDRIEGAVKL